MSLTYNKINMVINRIPILAESVNLDENSTQKPIKSFNNNLVFDYTPTNLEGTIEIKYYLEPQNEIIFSSLIKELNDITAPQPLTIGIGNSSVVGYLSDYSFNLSQNQIIIVNSTYKIYYPFTGNLALQNSGDSLYYDINQQSGIAHYWSAQFYSGNNLNNNNQILELGYSAKINLEPIYSLGNYLPVQIVINGIDENLEILGEQQINVQFTGQKLDNIFTQLQNLQLNNISSIWDNTINYNITIPLTGFVLTSTKNDMSVENLILWSNSFIRSK